MPGSNRIKAFDEDRLAVMAALDDIIGKTEHKNSGLSGHKLLLAFQPQNSFYRPATTIIEA